MTPENVKLCKYLLDIDDDVKDVDDEIVARIALPKYTLLKKYPKILPRNIKRMKTSRESWIQKYITECTDAKQLYDKFIVAHVPVPQAKQLLNDPNLEQYKQIMLQNMRDPTIFPHPWMQSLKWYREECMGILAEKPEWLQVPEVEEVKVGERNVPYIEKISSRGDMKEKIHSIHNFLRNRGMGYGMNALKIFNLLYGIRKIESYPDLFDKLKLNKLCKYSELIRLSKTTDGDEVFNTLNDEFLDYVHKSDLNKFLMVELPKHTKTKYLNKLINDIDKLVSSEINMNMSLSGKIYEYFIGRDESAISELGAYFTNRMLVQYIYNLAKPTLKGGGVRNMIDPFGGSGGFTIEYIIYLINEHKIDWSLNADKVYHIDMNNDVVQYAGMEYMCLTNEVPNMITNFRCANAFEHEFTTQYEYIYTNPPYGGDKNKKYGNRLKNDTLMKELQTLSKKDGIENDELAMMNAQIQECKSIEKWYLNEFDNSKVSLATSSVFIRSYAEKYKLSGNDKEAVSLILIMALLAPGGTATGVLKEGVLFDSKYADLRKHLLTYFDVQYVVSVPSDQFENTTTKTTIVVFHRPINEHKDGYATQEVEFRKLDVLKYAKNKVVFDNTTKRYELVEVADDPYGVSDPIVSTATIDEIKSNGWGLDGKKYNMKVLKPGKGYKMVKLGDIAKFKTNNILHPTESTFKLVKIGDIDNGSIISYNTVTKQNAKKSQVCTIGDILVSTVRPKSSKTILLTHHIENINTYCFTLGKIALTNKVLHNPYYIYAIIYKYSATFEVELANGSSYPRFNISDLSNIQIPIPEDSKVMDNWVQRISTPYDLKNQRERQLKELELEVSNEIKRITDEEPCDEYKLGDLCELVDGYDFYKRDLCEYNIDNTIPVIKNGDRSNTYALILEKWKKYLSVCGDILICTMGTIQIKINPYIRAYHGHHIYRVVHKTNTNPNYLYHIMIIILDVLKMQARGSVVKGVNKTTLSELVIKLPKDKKLIEAMEPKFQLIETYKQDIANADREFKDLIQELGRESISD